MSYQYSYLLLGVVFGLVWAALYWWRKDTRREMLIISLLFTLPGPISDLLYTRDWWRPITLTNTVFSLESMLVAFMIGGIGSVLYEDFFKKKVKVRKTKRKEIPQKLLHIELIFLFGAIIFFGSFYIFHTNSLVSSIIASFSPIILIWIKRHDLIIDSLASGVLLLITAIVVYSTLEILTPGWVDKFWYFQNTPRIKILNLPLDDVIWYFLAGLLIGPLYEYWLEGRMINQR